jgi:hypothetical protein
VDIKPGDVFTLPSRSGDIGVKILGIAKGVVSYYRIEGSGVVHTLPKEDFMRTYIKSIVKSALAEFDAQLEELINGK